MASRETVEMVIKVSAEGARTQVDALKKSVDNLDNSAKATTKAAGSLDTSLKDVSQGAGRAKESMEGVAAALSLVSPEAAMAVRNVGALTAGVKGMSAAGGSLLGVLGPVAVAVGALGFAYKKLSDDLDKANEKMAAAAATAKKAQEVFNPRGTVSGRAAGTEFAAGASFLEEQIEKERAAIAKAREELSNLGSYLGNAVTRRIDLQDQISGGETRLGGLTRALEGIDAKVAAATAKGAQEGSSVGSAAGVARGLSARPDELQSIIAESRTDLDAQAAFDEFQAFFGGPTSAVVTGVGGPVVTGVDTVQDPALGSARAQRFSDLTSATGGLLQGDVSGFLAMAGPVGAGVGALSNIGQMGASGVRDQLEGFTDSIVAGLEALPEILAEVIPDFVYALVADLIPALVETFPQLAKAIALDLPIALAKAIVDALASILPGGNADTGFIGKTANTVLDTLTFGGTLAADVGFGREGLGARSAGSSQRGSIDRSGRSTSRAGGGSQVVVQGSVFGSLDGLVRDLDTHLGYGGTGRSSVLGGR